MKTNKYKYILLAVLPVLTTLLFSCLPDGDYKTSVNHEPRDIGDGWEIGSAADHGFNTAKLQDIYKMMFSESEFMTSRSLLIVRNGKLVSESYFRDRDDINQKNSIQGITKSITSLFTGMAWDQELIQLDDSLYNFIPGHFDGVMDKRDIAVEHMLTMTIGLDWDDDANTVDLFNINRFPSSMRIVLTKPLLSPAGTVFYSNHGTPQLAMGIINKVFKTNSTDSIIHELFDHLGIEDFVWEQHSDGLNIGGLGLHLTPRDIARIGQFMLQEGWWGGKQIVSEEWIGKSTTAKVGTEMTGSSFGYGYYWWIHDKNKAYLGMCEGGQYLYIVPGKNLVIVHTANPSAGYGYNGIVPEDFLSLVNRILEAME